MKAHPINLRGEVLASLRIVGDATNEISRATTSMGSVLDVKFTPSTPTIIPNMTNGTDDAWAVIPNSDAGTLDMTASDGTNTNIAFALGATAKLVTPQAVTGVKIAIKDNEGKWIKATTAAVLADGATYYFYRDVDETGFDLESWTHITPTTIDVVDSAGTPYTLIKDTDYTLFPRTGAFKLKAGHAALTFPLTANFEVGYVYAKIPKKLVFGQRYMLNHNNLANVVVKDGVTTISAEKYTLDADFGSITFTDTTLAPTNDLVVTAVFGEVTEMQMMATLRIERTLEIIGFDPVQKQKWYAKYNNCYIEMTGMDFWQVDQKHNKLPLKWKVRYDENGDLGVFRRL